jgi:hypothetical protein
MALVWDLWIDYHRRDADGLTHASIKDVETGIDLVPGLFIVVGNEDADPAVAEVVTVEENGVVLVRVLDGAAEDHLHLVQHLHRAG